MKTHMTTLLAAAAFAVAASAHADSDTTSVSIGGSIGAGCTASAQPLDLGAVQSAVLFTDGVPADVTLTVNCSLDTPFAVSLGNSWTYVSQVGPTADLALDFSGPTIAGVPIGTSGSGMQYASTGTGTDETLTVTGGIVRATGRRAALGTVNATLTGMLTITY